MLEKSESIKRTILMVIFIFSRLRAILSWTGSTSEVHTFSGHFLFYSKKYNIAINKLY